jgi:hypothetical protein
MLSDKDEVERRKVKDLKGNLRLHFSRHFVRPFIWSKKTKGRKRERDREGERERDKGNSRK